MLISKTGPIVYFSDRLQWRAWLAANFQTEKEVWLLNPNKNSGKIRILYNDAVEEALCFNWIDSTVKSYNEENAMQRYTPRRKNSTFSQSNIERLKWLFKENKIHTNFKDEVHDLIGKKYIFPKDIIEIIKKDKLIWKNYNSFPDGYKRIRIAYIDGTRHRPEEFTKRLNHFLNKTKENKMLSGYGGIEKYYHL